MKITLITDKMEKDSCRVIKDVVCIFMGAVYIFIFSNRETALFHSKT